MSKNYFKNKSVILLLFTFLLIAPILNISAGEKNVILGDDNDSGAFSYPAVDTYNNNNLVAWMSLVDNNKIQSVKVYNTATEKILLNISMGTEIYFDSNEYGNNNKLKFSDNWLAFSYTEGGYSNIIVFEINGNTAEAIYQINNLCGSDFDLYGHKLVVFDDEYCNPLFKENRLYVVDLQKNNVMTIIKSDPHYEYHRMKIRDDKIVYIEDVGHLNLMLYDLKEGTDTILLEDVDIHYAPSLVFDGDNVIYSGGNEAGNNSFYLYNISTGENKMLFEYEKKVVGMDLSGKYFIFSFGDLYYTQSDGYKHWNIHLHDLGTEEFYDFGDKNYSQIQPVLSNDKIFWVDGVSGKDRISYIGYDLLAEENKTITNKIINSKLYSSLKGKIILKVEANGEAYYIHPSTQEMYYLGRPDDAFSVMREQGVGITNDNLEKIPIGFILEEEKYKENDSRCDWVGGYCEDNDNDRDGYYFNAVNNNCFNIPIGSNVCRYPPFNTVDECLKVCRKSGGMDSDNDGLSDIFEDAIGTDKNNKDTDGDGNDDDVEINNNYNPNGFGNLSYDNNFTDNQKGKIFLQVENNGEAWYINPNDGKRYFLGRPADAFQVMRNLGLGISNADFDSM